MNLLLSKAIPFLLDFDLEETADLFDSEEFLESIRLESGLEHGFSNMVWLQLSSLKMPNEGVESESYYWGFFITLVFKAV